ncbi:MAG TPA: hypothetical protein VMV10_05740, partial [Pirellulales bacterium]|nr:hypothetical protein [Pirellulales bacterium]HVA46275.1 hypothetical protein [Pirellulales bacterium]
AGHFRTSVWKGLEIIEGLRGHVSGLGVPTYVVDGLHGAGKIPLMPNYLVSASENAVILRNCDLVGRGRACCSATLLKTRTAASRATIPRWASAVFLAANLAP